MKGGILLATGYLSVHAYTSDALIPLADVAIKITDANDNTLAMALTDRSGTIAPVAITVPDPAAGQQPDTGVIPFGLVNLYAQKKDYLQIEGENLQIFPNTVTLQNLEMVPLGELPDRWNQDEIFNTPAKNL